MKKILWFSLLLFVVGVNAQTFTNSTKVIGIPTNNVINYSDTVLSNVVVYGNGVGLTNVHAASVVGIITNNITGNAFGAFVSPNVPDIDITGYQSNPLHYDAFPGLVKLANGTLMLVYRTGTNHLGYGSLVQRTSVDLGKTWSNVITNITDVLDLRDPSITQLQSGKLIMCFFKYSPITTGSTGPWLTSSTNNGTTWSTPENFGTLVGTPIMSAISAPIIETSSNNLVMAWYGSTVPPASNIQISHSSDGGATWVCDSGVATSDVLTEPNLVYLGGTSILMTIRNETTSYIMSCVSVNNGLTWSAPTNAFYGVGSPRLFKAASGNIYCFYRAHAPVWNKLVGSFVWRVSQNNGSTWSYEFGGEWQGLKHDFDYASACELETGTIGVVYALHYVIGPPCSLFFKTFKDSYNRPSAQVSNARVVDGILNLNNSDLRIGDEYGFTDFRPNAGQMQILPSTGVQLITPATRYYVPTLGTNTGPISIVSDTKLYGLWGSLTDNGDIWFQMQRSDAAATTYKMLLNPLGGNVSIGNAYPSGAKLQLGEPESGEAGLKVKSGTTAKGIQVLGRTTANGEGYIQFYNYDASVLQGAIYGITNEVRFADKDGTDVATIKSAKMGIGTMTPRLRLDVAEATAVAAPSLGTASGGFSMTEPSGAYGLIAGVYSDGMSWLQAQRFDGTATAYQMTLQPSGGNLTIGTSTSSGARVTIGEPGTGQAGLSVKSGSAADAINIIGRVTGEGVIAFRSADSTLEGSISGSANTVSINDSNAVSRIAVSQQVTTINGLTKHKAHTDGTAVQILGRAADDQGYLQFFENDGVTAEGSIYSGVGYLRIADSTGADTLSVYQNKIGIKTNLPSHQLTVSGSTYVTADMIVGGQLVFTNSVWDDLQVPGISVKVGANAPTFGAFPGQTEFSVYLFGGGATDNDVYFTAQLPHSYKEGTDIIAHVHWFPTTSSSSKNIIWTMKYEWKNIGEVINGTASTLGGTAVAVPATAGTHTITSFAAMSGAGKTISSMILCHLKREASNGLDTYTDDVGFLQVDFHYQKDTIGSSSSTTK